MPLPNRHMLETLVNEVSAVVLDEKEKAYYIDDDVWLLLAHSLCRQNLADFQIIKFYGVMGDIVRRRLL